MMEITWKELLKSNIRVQEAFGRIAIGDELHMMSHLLEMMTLVTAAKSLKKEASYLFLSLCFVTLGIDKEKHHAGFVGASLNSVVDKIVKALLSEELFLKKADISASMLLEKIVKFAIILSISIGTILKLNIKKNNFQLENQLIYTKTLITLASKTDVLKTTLKEFLSVCDTNEKWIESSSNILSFICSFLISHVSMKEKRNFNALLEILGDGLTKVLQKTDELLEQLLSDHRIKSEEISSIRKLITACKIALENESYDDFLNAIESGLDAMGLSKTGLEQEILETELTTVNLFNAMTRGTKEFSQNATQVSVVV